MIPTSAHNEALAGDVLYSAFLNHEWRTIVLPFVIAGMAKIAADIEDETERQDFEVLYGALIDDFYNEDEVVSDNTPVGLISPFIGEIANIPAKWLLCDGQTTYASADYPELFAILKPIWKSGSNFHTPDLRLQLVAGAIDDSGSSITAGASSVTLTEANLPAHHHVVPAHAHAFGTSGSGGSGTTATARGVTPNNTQATDTEPATNTSDVGSAEPFSLIPMQHRFHYIIKALP